MATRTDSAAPTLRRGILGLATLGMVGIALELLTERHWTKPTMLIAWGALALTALAVGLLLGEPSARRVRAAQLIALVVLASAAFGVWEHIEGNHEAGSLDYRYAETWDGLPPPTQWWLAARKAVGPAPPLAPGALALTALSVLLATAMHPALRAGRDA